MASEPPGLLRRCVASFTLKDDSLSLIHWTRPKMPLGLGDTVRWGGDPQAQKYADDHHKRMEDG